MPPASLSTLEVMIPGPITASSSVRRLRKPRNRFCRSVPRVRRPCALSAMASQFMRFPNLLLSFFTSLFPYFLLLDEPRNHIVHGNRPNRAILLTHHGERAQVVLVKQFEYVALIGVGGDAEQRFQLQLRQALLRCRQEQPSHRDGPGKLGIDVQ